MILAQFAIAAWDKHPSV